MKTFNYNPFPELGPYSIYPENRRLRRILLETIAYNPFPGISSWMIYQALKS